MGLLGRVLNEIPLSPPLGESVTSMQWSAGATPKKVHREREREGERGAKSYSICSGGENRETNQSSAIWLWLWCSTHAEPIREDCTQQCYAVNATRFNGNTSADCFPSPAPRVCLE